jgi:hypothetical protein
VQTERVQEMKIHKKSIVIMERLTRAGEKDDFDTIFWAKAGVQARFSALWHGVSTYYKLKGKDGTVPRLRRSVERIQRPGR